MLDSDKQEFSALLHATLKTYRIECDHEVMRIWWGVLCKYSMQTVRDGFVSYVSNPESKFAPVPANIIEMIESSQTDGRPGAEEAWAMYPHDESQSAVITTEMAEAMRIAYPLLEDGDKIGARMAFKEAYNRIVSNNKANGIQAKWFPSLGYDNEGRESAMNEAVEKGRITKEHAQSLIPAPKSALENFLPELKLLASKETDNEYAHNQIQKIKEMLKVKNHG